jgi:outer membrane protein assembly factor BamB
VPSTGRLLRLDRRDGAKLGELDLKGNVFGAPMVIGKDLVALTSEPLPDGSCGGTQVMKSVDDSLESVRWSRRSLHGWSSSRPYVWHGNVLAGGERGEIAAFRPGDGKLAWSDTLQGVIRGIGSDDDLLYVGTLNGTLYAYEPPDRRRR